MGCAVGNTGSICCVGWAEPAGAAGAGNLQLGADPPPTAPTKSKKGKEFAPSAADSVRGEGFTGQEAMEPI